MDDITLKLKKLTKTRKNHKLIYKQSNQKTGNVFITDVSAK